MLDGFSRAMSSALLERHPDWATYFGTRDNPDGTQHLVIRVPRPIADDPVGGVALYTDGGEVTVECGQHWHTHFRHDGDDPLAAALDFLDAVFAEETVCARLERGTTILGGTIMPRAAAEVLLAGGGLPGNARATANAADAAWLWSWRGTFDRRVALPPAA